MKKRVICFILLACLILSACGSSATAPAPSEAPAPSAAPAATSTPVLTPSPTTKPSQTPNPYVEVEITKDNFYDYFEFVEIADRYINSYGTVNRDSSGNIKGILSASGLFLKDNYSLANGCSLKIGIKYIVLSDFETFVDFKEDEMTYKIVRKTSFTNPYDELLEGKYYGNGDQKTFAVLFGTFWYGEVGVKMAVDPSSIEIVSVSGKLYLKG